jgi:protocatechuate 3,4-dioxygenase beta subunit
MNPLQRISRRDLLRLTMAAGVGLAVPTIAFARQCEKSPAQSEGPFYMNTWDRTKPVPHHNDLTWVTDSSKKAEGEVIYLTGQVSDLDCKPLKGVMVEIWQACRSGRYAHLADPNPAWLDPNFRYFGEFVTDANGMYSFKTIKPGPYPVGPNWTRPAHVHFKISAGLTARMLTTQMYFAGDRHLGSDRVLSRVPKPQQQRLIIEPTRRQDASTADQYTFDIHLVPFKV